MDCKIPLLTMNHWELVRPPVPVSSSATLQEPSTGLPGLRVHRWKGAGPGCASRGMGGSVPTQSGKVSTPLGFRSQRRALENTGWIGPLQKIIQNQR